MSGRGGAGNILRGLEQSKKVAEVRVDLYSFPSLLLPAAPPMLGFSRHH